MKLPAIPPDIFGDTFRNIVEMRLEENGDHEMQSSIRSVAYYFCFIIVKVLKEYSGLYMCIHTG